MRRALFDTVRTFTREVRDGKWRTLRLWTQTSIIASYLTGFAWAIDWWVRGSNLKALGIVLTWVVIATLVATLVYLDIGPENQARLMHPAVWAVACIGSFYVVQLGLLIDKPNGVAAVTAGGIAGLVAPIFGKAAKTWKAESRAAELAKRPFSSRVSGSPGSDRSLGSGHGG